MSTKNQKLDKNTWKGKVAVCFHCVELWLLLFPHTSISCWTAWKKKHAWQRLEPAICIQGLPAGTNTFTSVCKRMGNWNHNNCPPKRKSNIPFHCFDPQIVNYHWEQCSAPGEQLGWTTFKVVGCNYKYNHTLKWMYTSIVSCQPTGKLHCITVYLNSGN